MEKEEELIISTDMSFSDYSVKHGFTEAFMLFAADKAVLLRKNSMPIKGTDSLTVLYGKMDDSKIELSWEPLFVKVSKSGDLGYTYGKYTLLNKGTKSEPEHGTYVTIWEKQDDGSWKWILDSGNEGIE
jgi:ketosteroid isomerase-like protein